MNTVTRLVLLTFLATVATLHCPAQAGITSMKEVQDLEQRRVTSEQPCTVGKEVEVTLKPNEAVRLTCPDSPFGIKSVILYYHAEEILGVKGMIFLDFYFASGLTSMGSVRLDMNGEVKQVGTSPCLSFTTWQVKDVDLAVKFLLSSDKVRNGELYAELGRKGRIGASMNDPGKVLPPVELSETERLAGFVKLWSEIKYNFAFLYRVPNLDWDKTLVEYLPKVQKARTTAEYYKVLRQFIALLHDGHTTVWGPTDDPACNPPVWAMPYQGKAVIVEVAASDVMKDPSLRAELEKADLHIGDEITQVDGRAVKDVLEQDLYPYIASSTPQWRDLEAYPRLVAGKEGTKAVLTLRGSDGNVRQVTLTRGYYNRRQDALVGYECRELGNGIVYVNLLGIGEDTLNQFDASFDKILHAKGLIIDVRKNGGGNSHIGDEIISRLIDKEIENTLWKTPQHVAAFKAWGKPQKWYEGERKSIQPRNGDRYTGPLVVLTGPATFSAAEDFVVPLHASGRATIVGERTGGSTGQPLPIGLPGGGGARICTKWDTYPDGREFVGVGVIPDVEVQPTPQDIAAKHDVVLEKAVELIQGKVDGKTAGSKPSPATTQPTAR